MRVHNARERPRLELAATPVVRSSHWYGPGMKQRGAPQSSRATWASGGEVPPGSIRAAVTLMCVAGGISLLSSVITSAAAGLLTDEGLRRVLYLILEWAGVLALWGWMAWKNGGGRRWARTLATVLGALNVAFLAFALLVVSSDGNPFLMSALGIEMLLAPVILVLLWRPESTDFYAASEG